MQLLDRVGSGCVVGLHLGTAGTGFRKGLRNHSFSECDASMVAEFSSFLRAPSLGFTFLQKIRKACRDFVALLGRAASASSESARWAEWLT